MNALTYRICRISTAAVVGAAAAVAVIIGNVYILAGAIVLGMVVLLLARRRVTQVIYDERTYSIVYKASRAAMALTGIGMALTGAVLLALHRDDFASAPAQVGFALEYATCALLLVNLAAYIYYSRKMGGGSE